MNKLLSRVRYVLVSLMFAGTMTATSLTPVFATPGNGGGNPNPPANNGTLKIHEQGTPSGTENNDPKVCVFNVEGFGFDTAQTGYLQFSVQGGDGPTGTASGPHSFGPTNVDGYYASQYFNLDPGHYKATLYGKDTGGLINLADEKAKSKVFKVKCDIKVTPAAVTFDDKCATANDRYTIPATTGVKYFVNGSETATAAGTYTPSAGQTVTVVAKAKTGYVLHSEATSQWSHAFTNVPCEVVLIPVTPAPVTFDDNCGLDNDRYLIPNTQFVNYTYNSSILTPGYHSTFTQTSVTIVAYAETGYVLTGQGTWTFDFTNVACPCNCDTPREVTAPNVVFRDKCAMDKDTFVIPSKDGVKYKINGQVIAAGTYNAHDYDVNGTVTVTAHSTDRTKYTLVGTKTWSHSFTNEACKVRADKPMFKDLCEMRNDTYNIPETEGVYYKVNNVEKDAGTYPASGTVTITAHAKEGYKLKGHSSWSYTYTNEECEQPPVDVCPNITGNQTMVPEGMIKDNQGNCVTPPVIVDACPNIEGNQSTVPSGMTKDSQGNCVTPPVVGGGGGGGFVLGDTFTPPVVAAQPQVLADTGASSVTSTLVAVFVLITALAVYAFNPKFETR